MQTVILPNGDTADFPDDMQPSVIEAYIKRHLVKQKPSTGEDVAKSAAWAIPKAITGIVGAPGSIVGLLDRGSEWLNSKFFGGKPEDYRIPGVSDKIDAAAIRKGIEGQTGEWYDPQTRAGKVVDTGIQTAATMGKSWLTAPKAAAGIVAGSTAGTEGLGAATNDNPVARFLGGLLGGAGPTIANAAKSRPGVVVRDMLGELTDEQIRRALEMQARGQASGVPLMGSEALDTGHQLASAVYASNSGNKVLEPFLRQRPEQVTGAVNRDIISKTGRRASPNENAAAAQRAATDVVSNAERARTAAVQPYYKAAEYETIPPQSLRPVASEIEQQIYRQPIGSSVDKDLGSAYNQIFQQIDTKVAAAPKARGPMVTPGVNPDKDDIVTAIRKLGGLNMNDPDIGSGVVKGLSFPPDPRLGPVWSKAQNAGSTGTSSSVARGKSLDEMAARLREYGYIGADDPIDAVLDKLSDMSTGVAVHGSAFKQYGGGDPLAFAIDKLTEQLAVKSAPKVPDVFSTSVVPETNVGRLNTLYKNLRDAETVPAIGATSAQKSAARPIGKVAESLGDVLSRENANIRKGQSVYQQFTRDQIDPLTSGDIGRIAGKGYDPAVLPPASRVLSVFDSATARPDTIREVYSRLNAVDKQAFPGMVQTHLENKLNDALASLRPGPNPTAGQKFRQAIAGTPIDEANFREMMRGVAKAHGLNEQQVIKGADNLLEVLERTGRTPGVGSQTAPRMEVTKELGKTKTGDVLSAVSSQPLESWRGRLRDWTLRGRYEDLAKVLTAPDSVQQLVKLGKYKPDGTTAAYTVSQILGLTASGQGSQ